MKHFKFIQIILASSIVALFMFLLFTLNQELKSRVDKPIFGNFYSKKQDKTTVDLIKTRKKPYLKWGTLRRFKKLRERAFLHLDKGNRYKAMINFHRAKMVIPDDFKTRIDLADVFTQMCLKENRYCGNAQREIKNAVKFTRNIEKKNLQEKDIVRLFKLKKLMKSYTCVHFQKTCK